MSAERLAPPSAAAQGDARRYAPLPEPLVLHRGGELRGGRIAYETWGRLNAARDNAILLFTGLSPSAHAASSAEDPREGWWEEMIGAGRAIDTDRYFVICVNSLGSCFGSSGPASDEPATGTRWRLRFPEISVEDIAQGGRAVLRQLGLDQVHTVAGPSLGGMVAVAFVALFPGVARRLLSISGSDAASPLAIALRAVQREAVLSDPAWQGGQYPVDQPPRAGMRLARKVGTITYRSAAEWNERFGRLPLDSGAVAPVRANAFAPEFAIEGYLEWQAERFWKSFDANCYLYLSRALDRFELGAHGEPAALFARARLESALVIGVESDLLFPIAEQARIAAALSAADVPTTFARLDCREGHDAFLVDIPAFDAVIRRYLATTR